MYSLLHITAVEGEAFILIGEGILKRGQQQRKL